MSPHPLPMLPTFDRRLLRCIAPLVPAPERSDWTRTWQAELWHIHHHRRSYPTRSIRADLALGLIRDALWLRTEACKRALHGTVTLCFATLLGASLLCITLALVFEGGWRALTPSLTAQFDRSLFAAPLVLFVAFATSSRRHVEPVSPRTTLFWLRRQLFFAAKIAQVLFLAFLLSSVLSQPLLAPLPITSVLIQLFLFVLLSLFGLRWAFGDQDHRCKQCLRSLASPSRKGRPSHNLLEWNGTELSCTAGHGHLSVPEIETSWCQSSFWIPQS